MQIYTKFDGFQSIIIKIPVGCDLLSTYDKSIAFPVYPFSLGTAGIVANSIPKRIKADFPRSVKSVTKLNC